MNQVFRLIGVAFILCYSACGSQSVSETEILLPEASHEKGDVLLIAKKGAIERVYVIGDALCKYFVHGQKEHILELEGIDSTKVTKTYVKYGKGKENLLLAIASRGQNQLLLHDLLQGKVVQVDVNRAISDERYCPDVYSCDIKSQEIIPIGGRELLYLNPYSWEKGSPRFYWSDQNGQEHHHRQGRKNGFSVINGELVYNGEQNLVAFVDRFNPIIEIWTGEGEQLRRIRVAEKRLAEIREVEINGEIDYYFVNTVPCCFSSANGNDAVLAAAYQNGDGISCVFILNWDGVLLQSFKVPGKVKEISLSVSSDNVYCWSSFDDEDRLVRYSL